MFNFECKGCETAFHFSLYFVDNVLYILHKLGNLY